MKATSPKINKKKETLRVAIQLSEKRGRLGIAWLNELEGSIRGSGKFVRA